MRVTRIDQPEAMLLAPEQAFFLRENLKLRLLNARLALLSRQFDTAQSDLRDAQAALDRYFDRSSRRVGAGQRAGAPGGRRRRARSALPRPDDTLAALAARRPAAEPRARRPHAQRHLAGAAVRGGRGGRHHAGQQRRPGHASTGAAGGSTCR